MKNLSIDIETYSEVDLNKCGVYKYAESTSFEVLLFSYSVDSGEVACIDIASGEKLPSCVIDALEDNNVCKWAYNANFERVCLSRYLGLPRCTYLDPTSWKCSMVWASTLGLPLALVGAGAVLGLSKQKIEEGKDLIKYFCKPCMPTKKNGGRTRNLPWHDRTKWERFKEYNIRDVEVELAIKDKLKNYPVSADVWQQYITDQRINDRGVKLDVQFVQSAISVDRNVTAMLTNRMKEITSLENPNSVSQLKSWLASKGLSVGSLSKKDVSELIDVAPDDVKPALVMRQKTSRSSVSKYKKMESSVCSDGRARGMFQFYGANRTGRWAGRLIQLQNLPQNHLADLDTPRELVCANNVSALTMLYDDVPDVLSQLVRTAFVPREGKKFIVADFSAIEARVIAWVAGEKWRLQAFERGEDIYCASATQMFGVPVEKHGVNSHLRQKGKLAELSNGYGGSVGALKAMGALEMGLKEDELKPLVDSWRESNPNITDFWWSVDTCAKTAVKNKSMEETHGITFECKSGMLFITLPSRRKLAYVKPKIGTNKFGGECITYEGTLTGRKWGRLETYGPKLVENIVQGTARDLLAHAMQNLADYDIVMHIHDEVVVEADLDVSVREICAHMETAPSWAEDLQLKADGYECEFYQKQ